MKRVVAKKLFPIMVFAALGAGSSFAEPSAQSTNPPSAHAAHKAASGNVVRHRGTNPAAVGGAAKKPAGVSGANVRLKRY